MKARKMFFVLVLAALLLLGTVLVASAANTARLTGSFHYDYEETGRAWSTLNVSFDPVTYDAEGVIHYRVYGVNENPKEWESWVGEPVCAALGEIDGHPAVSLVVQVVEQNNIDPAWVEEYPYMKYTVIDGGQNASEDWFGLVVWDLLNNHPVADMPSCEFEEPLPFAIWPGVHGNFTIHD